MTIMRPCPIGPVRLAIWVAAVLVASSVLEAQRGEAPGRGGPPPTPRAAAAFDLAGTWVAVVTEDWRWRMVTPPKNDVSSVPFERYRVNTNIDEVLTASVSPAATILPSGCNATAQPWPDPAGAPW